MATQKIKFTVKKNGGGAFKVETMEGFTGTSCENTVDQILVSVGAKTQDSGNKDDQYKNNDPIAWVNAD